MNRRQAISNLVIIMYGYLSVDNDNIFTSNISNKISGLQLFAVRRDMFQNPVNTLEKIREIGFEKIEHANYRSEKFYGFTSKEFRKILDGLGMNLISGHISLNRNHWNKTQNDFNDEWKKTVDDCVIAGQEYLISPTWPSGRELGNLDDVKHNTELFNKCGEFCLDRGIKFGYHNHNFEFEKKYDGRLLYEIIMELTDSALVYHQLDFGNMYNSNEDIIRLIRRYKGRFETIHLKDILPVKGEPGKFESTILGEGVLPIKKILKDLLDKGGTKHIFLEQEHYQQFDPIEAVKCNFRILREWGYI